MKKQKIAVLMLISSALFFPCRLVLGETGSLTNIPPSIKIPSPPVTFYLTDDGNNIFGGGPGKVELRTADLIQMFQASETWAAEQDPEGNWSSVVGGFQISIRFLQSNFTNKQDIVAKVLVRNVSNQALGFPAIRDAGLPSYGALGNNFEFEIIAPDGKQLSGRKRTDSMLPKQLLVQKGTQKKLLFRLAGEFAFELPGEYRIKAKTLVHPLGERFKMVTLETQEATLKLSK